MCTGTLVPWRPGRFADAVPADRGEPVVLMNGHLQIAEGLGQCAARNLPGVRGDQGLSLVSVGRGLGEGGRLAAWKGRPSWRDFDTVLRERLSA